MVGLGGSVSTLPGEDSNPASLADFAGRTIVVYVHPKADTPR